MHCQLCEMFLAKETAPMLYCTVHARLYVSSLGQWLTVPNVPGVMVEGSCDSCMHEAKAVLRQQFPDLYKMPEDRARQIFSEECVMTP